MRNKIFGPIVLTSAFVFMAGLLVSCNKTTDFFFADSSVSAGGDTSTGVELTNSPDSFPGVGSGENSQSAVSNGSGSEAFSKGREKYEEIQDSVDHGHEPGWLNPEEVAMDFASRTLDIPDFGKTYDKIEKSISGESATVTFKKSGKPVITMKLCQPVKKGAGGIWVVTSWTDGRTNTNHVVEETIQEGS